MENNFYIFGKGELAIYCAELFISKFTNKSLKIIPTIPEPSWTASITDWAYKNNIELLDFKYVEENLLPKNAIGISIYYDKIFKKETINKFYRLCNIHNGPLPKYQGMNPINWALKNNEPTHGVTLHMIDEGIDTGPILDQEIFFINQEMEVEDVYKLCIQAGKKLLDNNLFTIDKTIPKKQDLEKSLYYSKDDFKNLGDRKDFRRN